MMLRQIQYFQAVVRCGSFTEAAEQCHISQSAISQQIQALERELGTPLLVRHNRRFSLTPSGEYFYNKSLVLTADLERLCRKTAQLAHRGEETLRVGYLRSYGGPEVQQALVDFAQKYPDISVRTVAGNHEDLYEQLRTEQVDLVVNDQRRAFSDEYVNLLLAERPCCIELPARSSIAQAESVTPADLKNTPCILLAPPAQQDNERAYYHEVVGFQGEFLFADTLDEARLLVLEGRGFLPLEGGALPEHFRQALCRVPLERGGHPLLRHYCAFWKTDNSGYYVEEFADMLKARFAQI